MKTLIPEADIKAALDAAIAILAETSQEHAQEIGRYIHQSFRPNPELVPIGVAMMFHQGAPTLERTMQKAVWGEPMINISTNLVLEQLRKLPGVDDVFQRFSNQVG